MQLQSEALGVIVNGVPLLVLVFGLVEFLKKFNVQGNWLTAGSMAIGLVLGLLYQVSLKYIGFADWYGMVIWALALGLAASGLYDFVDQRFPKVK